MGKIIIGQTLRIIIRIVWKKKFDFLKSQLVLDFPIDLIFSRSKFGAILTDLTTNPSLTYDGFLGHFILPPLQ